MADDPARLEFRTDIRPARKPPRSAPTFWVIVAVIVAFASLWVLRGVLARSSETAGRSASSSIPAAVPAERPAEVTAIETRRSGDWVYKCVGTGEVVAFRSQPCAKDERTLDRVLAIRDTQADVARARARERQAIRRADRMATLAGTNAYGYANLGGDVDDRRARCNAAKASRDDTLRRVGLARTYELLQRLDEQVREACKGVEP